MITDNLDIDAFKALSPEEQKVALEILKQYSATGYSDLLTSLNNSDWDEIPVDIHTFMHDKKYLGNALYDTDGRFTVFPYWETCLKDIFPTNMTTKYNNIIFTGAIGLGKSTIAVICQLYMLYRLLCLHDPYQYYGMQSIDKISISMMNITLENARGVAMDKMNQMILASEWFMSHGHMAGVTNLVYRPDKHIEIICASSNNQIIGRALFVNFTDEVNFSLVSDPEKQKARMMKMITQIDARMKSRFMRTNADGSSYLPTLNIIASSKDSEQSFLEAYIKNKKEAESKNTLIVDEPQWVVDSRKDSPVKFWVAVGDNLHANELLPLTVTQEQLDEYRKNGYNLWQVPIGYLDTFQLNLDEAICSIIGIATAATLKFILNDKLKAAKTAEYMNPFINDVLEIGTNDELQYSNYFNLSLVNSEDMEKPLFIHLDMSSSKDKTGIAGVWITGKEAMTKPISEETAKSAGLLNVETAEQAASLSYKLAFSVSIKAPKGAQISYTKNRIFINWLKDQGFDIKKISADTYQSTSTLQELVSDGFETEIVTVDRLTPLPNKRKICLPYYNLRNAIYERRIKIYDKCDLLTTELIQLEKESDGHINHPDNGKHGSKDQADAVCGATWLAGKYAPIYAQEYGESVSTAVSVSVESTNTKEYQKHLVDDFEKELVSISGGYIPVDRKNNTITNPFDTDLNVDVANGLLWF